MKKVLLTISTLLIIVTLSACTQEEQQETVSRNIPGLTENLEISGEIVNKRDHDFSIQLKNDLGTSDWISLGNEVNTPDGETINFTELTIGKNITVVCEDEECEFGTSVEIN